MHSVSRMLCCSLLVRCRESAQLALQLQVCHSVCHSCHPLHSHIYRITDIHNKLVAFHPTHITGMTLIAIAYPDDSERSSAMGISLGGISLGVLSKLGKQREGNERVSRFNMFMIGFLHR